MALVHRGTDNTGARTDPRRTATRLRISDVVTPQLKTVVQSPAAQAARFAHQRRAFTTRSSRLRQRIGIAVDRIGLILPRRDGNDQHDLGGLAQPARDQQ